ncbi:MAG: ATP-dependent DNA helicase [Burkholderiaceae bacterium]|nr:ATP-dependent DNA helicase [Burkholderiaceae bacterium]
MKQSTYTVAVRTLCEFTAKCGDLDLRFSPSPSAQEGISGHAQVSARRSAAYQREIKLMGEFAELRVKGRADGYDPEQRVLEEIKTYRGGLRNMPQNHQQLHWAQAKVYGHLFCTQEKLSELQIALVYFDVDLGTETSLLEQFQASELADYFNQLCTKFLSWARAEMQHRDARDAGIRALAFPHENFRTGQRELAEAVYKANQRACALLAQAPTGIGKTIASIFPSLKAAEKQGVDKIFFLAAKTSGRQLALDALSNLQKSTSLTRFRVLELVAKAKSCEYPDKACHGDSCPLAKGFYDRLPNARGAALEQPILDKDTLRKVALTHQVCPYYLSLDLARWCDVIVGDYNYYFDLNALLFGLAQQHDWKISLMVDEAHNMVARCRAMYSCELDFHLLQQSIKNAPATLKKPLKRLCRVWKKLEPETNNKARSEYIAHTTIPAGLSHAVAELLEAFGAELNKQEEHTPNNAQTELQRFFFEVNHFKQLLDSFAEHAVIELQRSSKQSTLGIRNMVPAPYLKPRWKASHSSILFSATLSPWHYYADCLGLPDNTAWVDVDAPFHAAQLRVKVMRNISTRYADRANSLPSIAALMAQQFNKKAGNYLAFFSSFDYLDQAFNLLQKQHPHITVWQQTPAMNEADRHAFLNHFTNDSQGIGFAVLGGAFAEGIDLPGNRLIGAFIATLGLPQMNPSNEQLKQTMQGLFGAGYDYTYLYPGLQKVVQAAGRVIRTPEDRGVIYLMDDRYAQADVQKLLPRWWKTEMSGNQTN